MFVRTSGIVLLAVLGATVAAQNYVAYPLDALHATTGQMIPLGASAVSPYNFDESRSQFLIPARYLPSTGGAITAIEVSPHIPFAGGAITYQSLTISMGLTTATALTPTFAVNLPNPTVVYSVLNQTINYGPSTTWTPIVLYSPFAYDGTSNLVIEIQKVIDRPGNPPAATTSHQLMNYPTRTDLPAPIWAFGVYGSGASNAPTATVTSGSRMLMRFRWGTNRTLVISSTRTGSQNYFHLGSTLSLVAQGMPGELFINTVDVTLSPVPILVAPVNGYYRLLSLFNIFYLGIIDGTGRGSFSFMVPNEPGLVGLQVYFQSLTAGADLNWTNVVDCIVAP